MRTGVDQRADYGADSEQGGSGGKFTGRVGQCVRRRELGRESWGEGKRAGQLVRIGTSSCLMAG